MKAGWIMAALLGALAAGGCKKPEPKSGEEVVAEARRLTKPEPGMYETSVKLVNFAMPGMPADQLNQLQEQFGAMANRKASQCLTAADADAGFEQVVRQLGEGVGGMQCVFDRFAADGGKLDAAMACTGPGGMKAQIGIDGTVVRDRSAMTMTIEQQMGPMPGGMTMQMQFDSRRTGPC